MDLTQEKYCIVRPPSAFAVHHLIYSDAMGAEHQSHFLIDRATFHNYVLIHVERGIFCLEQYGQLLRAAAGTTLVVDLHDSHRYYFEQNVPSRILWFHFSGLPAQSVIEALRTAKLLPAVAVLEGAAQKILEIFSLTDRGEPGWELTLSRQIYSLLMEFLQLQQPRLQAPYDRELPFARETAAYIQLHLREKLTLDQLARQAGRSRTSYCAAFHAQFGMTPMVYIRQQRVELAKQLLLCTADPICEISAALQFHDQSYFSNTFREATGMTPRKFRLQNRSQERDICV